MYDKKINSGDRLCNTPRSFGSISPLSLAKIKNKAKSLSLMKIIWREHVSFY